MSFGLGREWYVIDIGDDASDAPTKRSAIARAKAHVKGGPDGTGVWTGFDMHEVTVPAAMVYRSDERIQPDEREYVFAVWRGTADPISIDEQAQEIHQSTDPETVKTIQNLLNPHHKNPARPGEKSKPMKTLAAKKLTAKFKPESLKPGTYQTDSSTKAYPAVRYLVDTGKAELVREEFLGKGRVRLVVNVHGAKQNPIEGEFEETGRMRPTTEWMENRFREYKDFKTAWWRESIQNAVDAGATRIELVCKQLPDGNWLVSCSDNGKGMTKEQVQDEKTGFLMFGGTSKTFSASSTGAFGAAKQMLVLPWISYRLLTGDSEYVGKHDEWGRKTATPRQGVMLEVVMPADEEKHTTPEHAMHVLRRSWIPNVTFILNGEVVATGTPTPTDEKKKLDEIRNVAVIWEYPKKKNEKPEVLVRKNGIWMFSEEFPESAKHSVIVEILAPSPKVFAENRDVFRGWDGSQVENRIREMSAEIASEGKIRKKQRKPYEMFYRGTGQFTVGSELREREMEIEEAMGPMPEVTGPKGVPIKSELVETVIQKLNTFGEKDLQQLGERISRAAASEGAEPPNPDEVRTLMQIMMGSPEAARVIMGATILRGQPSMDAAVRQIVWQPSFYIYADEDLKYHVPPKFKPEKMTPAVLRLIKTWSELCRFILVQTGSNAKYGVGFWFSEEHGAGYMYRKGQHWLMLDPHKDKAERKEIYNPADAEDLAALWALALHEVAHMLVQIRWGSTPDDSEPVKPAGHGSDMANVLTDLQKKLGPHYGAVKKIAASIKLRGQMPKPLPSKALPDRAGGSFTDAESLAKAISNFVTLYHRVVQTGKYEDESAALAYNFMLKEMLRGISAKHRSLADPRKSYPFIKYLYHNDAVYDGPLFLKIRPGPASAGDRYVVSIGVNCFDIDAPVCSSLKYVIDQTNEWIRAPRFANRYPNVSDVGAYAEFESDWEYWTPAPLPNPAMQPMLAKRGRLFPFNSEEPLPNGAYVHVQVGMSKNDDWLLWISAGKDEIVNISVKSIKDVGRMIEELMPRAKWNPLGRSLLKMWSTAKESDWRG